MNDDLIKAIKNDRFAKYIGIELVRVEPGFAVTRMEITEDHLNGVDIVQGGATYTLADYAFAAASNAKGRITVGVQSSITYFKPPKGKFLTAQAKEVSATRSLCSYSIDVFDETDTLIARMSACGYIKA
ncbi:MAG: PaaI family thioesterase [Clostridia bacterium]|nr:PaaI family thioesterase [Clostridia bacterium]